MNSINIVSQASNGGVYGNAFYNAVTARIAAEATTAIKFAMDSGNIESGEIVLYGIVNSQENKMPRYHNVNGKTVQFTADEETARDAEEAAWAAGPTPVQRRLCAKNVIRDQQNVIGWLILT